MKNVLQFDIEAEKTIVKSSKNEQSMVIKSVNENDLINQSYC